jgi:hypothetical protein
VELGRRFTGRFQFELDTFSDTAPLEIALAQVGIIDDVFSRFILKGGRIRRPLADRRFHCYLGLTVLANLANNGAKEYGELKGHETQRDNCYHIKHLLLRILIDHQKKAEVPIARYCLYEKVLYVPSSLGQFSFHVAGIPLEELPVVDEQVPWDGVDLQDRSREIFSLFLRLTGISKGAQRKYRLYRDEYNSSLVTYARDYRCSDVDESLETNPQERRDFDSLWDTDLTPPDAHIWRDDHDE